MSFVIAGQEAMASAAGNLGDIGSLITQANATAAAQTTTVAAPVSMAAPPAPAAHAGSCWVSKGRLGPTTDVEAL